MSLKVTGNSEIYAKTAFLIAAAGASQMIDTVAPGSGAYILAGVSYLTNRLSTRADEKERAKLPGWEALSVNGHLAKMAAEATQTVLKAEIDEPEMKHHNAHWLAYMRDHAAEGWLDCMSKVRVDGQDMTAVIARRTTQGADVQAFTPDDWSVFVSYILPEDHSKGGPSGDFIEEVTALLRAKFAHYFYELAKQSETRDPAAHAALMFHFFGALTEGQKRIEGKIDDLDDFIRKSRELAVISTAKLSGTQAKRFGSLMKSFVEKVDSLDDVIKRLEEEVAREVRSGLKEVALPALHEEGKKTRREVRSLLPALDKRFAIIAAAGLVLAWLGYLGIGKVLQNQEKHYALLQELSAPYAKEKQSQSEARNANEGGAAAAGEDYRKKYAVQLGLGVEELDAAFSEAGRKLFKEAGRLKAAALSKPGGARSAWPAVFQKYEAAADAALAGGDVELRYAALQQMAVIGRIAHDVEARVMALRALAGVESHQSRHDTAAQTFQQAADVAWRAMKPGLWLDVCAEMATHYVRAGRVTAAITKSKEAIAVAEQLKLVNTTSFCHLLFRHAQVVADAGEPEAADELMTRAIQLHGTACADPECANKSHFIIGRAQLRLQLGRYDEVEQALSEAAHVFSRDDPVILELRARLALKRHVRQALSGGARSADGDLALKLSREALDSVRKKPGVSSREIKVCMMNIASIQLSLDGNARSALKTIDAAIAEQIAAHGEHSRDLTLLKLQKAQYLQCDGDTAAALALYETVYNEAATFDGADPERADILSGYLSCLFQMKRPQQMEAPLQELRALGQSHPKLVNDYKQFQLTMWSAFLEHSRGNAVQANQQLEQLREMAARHGEEAKPTGNMVDLLQHFFSSLSGQQVEKQKVDDSLSGVGPSLSDDNALIGFNFIRARTLLWSGHVIEAVSLLEDVERQARDKSADKADQLRYQTELAIAYDAAGRAADAQAIFDRARDALLADTGKWQLLDAHSALVCADHLIEGAKVGEAWTDSALQLLDPVIGHYEQNVTEQSTDLAHARWLRARCRLDKKDDAGAEADALASVKTYTCAEFALGVPLLNSLWTLSQAQMQLKRQAAQLQPLVDGAVLLSVRQIPDANPNGYRLWRLADNLIVTGHAQHARPLLDLAMRIDTHLFTERSLPVARNCNLIGFAHWTQKQPEQAAKFWERGLRLVGGIREESQARTQILADLKRNYTQHLTQQSLPAKQIESHIQRLLDGDDEE